MIHAMKEDSREDAKARNKEESEKLADDGTTLRDFAASRETLIVNDAFQGFIRGLICWVKRDSLAA
jgi:hypothetical protein